MVSYSRRPQSGQITCYLNRTYHVLLTPSNLEAVHELTGSSVSGMFTFSYFGWTLLDRMYSSITRSSELCSRRTYSIASRTAP
jgi:hypothetical protein